MKKTKSNNSDKSIAIELITHTSHNYIEPHHTRAYQVGYVVSGTIALVVDNQLHHIHKDEYYVLRRGNYYVQYIAERKEACTEIRLTLDDHFVAANLHDIAISFGQHLHTHDNPHSTNYAHEKAPRPLRNYFNTLTDPTTLTLLSHSTPYRHTKARELLLLALNTPNSSIANLLHHFELGSRAHIEMVVERYIIQKTSIEFLASKCNMSTSKFKKHFRELFNDTPHHWMTLRRLELAKTILTTSNTPIKSISLECGFTSPSHMIRLFRTTYGISPNHFRQLHIEPTSVAVNRHTPNTADNKEIKLRGGIYKFI